jgi:DUF2975 family protein
MPSRPPSRAVRWGYALVTLLLVLALVFGAVSVVSIAVGLARHGDSLLYGDPLTLPFQLPPETLTSLPRGVRPAGWVDVRVDVHDPSSKQMLLRSAQDIGPLVLLIAGLWLLRGFLRSVLAGDPFGPASVRRLRAIGFILVLGAPVVAFLNYSFRLALFNDIPPVGGNLGSKGFALPGTALLGGLGAFILAEVFAYGLRLREDVEGTV